MICKMTKSAGAFSILYTRGEFNKASARERSLFWYLSLFVMCKAWHQYIERSRALTLLNSPLVAKSLCFIDCYTDFVRIAILVMDCVAV